MLLLQGKEKFHVAIIQKVCFPFILVSTLNGYHYVIEANVQKMSSAESNLGSDIILHKVMASSFVITFLYISASF